MTYPVLLISAPYDWNKINSSVGWQSVLPEGMVSVALVWLTVL